MQVPPTCAFSTSTVFRPASASARARGTPPCPAPTTIASTVSGVLMGASFGQRILGTLLDEAPRHPRGKPRRDPRDVLRGLRPRELGVRHPALLDPPRAAREGPGPAPGARPRPRGPRERG